MNKRYRVRLTETEREHLEAVVTKGKAAAYKIKHAPILLKVDTSGPQWTDERVAEAFGCHRRTVANVRQRFVEQGLESALERKPRLSRVANRSAMARRKPNWSPCAVARPPKVMDAGRCGYWLTERCHWKLSPPFVTRRCAKY